jgi:hypothetical protein
MFWIFCTTWIILNSYAHIFWTQPHTDHNMRIYKLRLQFLSKIMYPFLVFSIIHSVKIINFIQTTSKNLKFGSDKKGRAPAHIFLPPCQFTETNITNPSLPPKSKGSLPNLKPNSSLHPHAHRLTPPSSPSSGSPPPLPLASLCLDPWSAAGQVRDLDGGERGRRAATAKLVWGGWASGGRAPVRGAVWLQQPHACAAVGAPHLPCREGPHSVHADRIWEDRRVLPPCHQRLRPWCSGRWDRGSFNRTARPSTLILVPTRELAQ